MARSRRRSSSGPPAIPASRSLALGRPELDLEQPATVDAAILAAKPDLVVNAAAYTAVDKAEAEPERAFAANRDGAAAAAAAARGAWRSVHSSVHGLCLSGRQADALCRERCHRPARRLWPVEARRRAGGAGGASGRAHPPHLLGLQPVRRQFRQDHAAPRPRTAMWSGWSTTSRAIRPAPSISPMPSCGSRLACGRSRQGGIYHLCGSGSTTWCGFARRDLRRERASCGGPAPRVEAITTADYPTPARRPANSRLDMAAFTRRFGFALRPWPEALAETVARLLA